MHQLFIGNIPYHATDADVEASLSDFGEVAQLRLPRNVDGGLRGFGFVTMRDDDAARRLLAAHAFPCRGRTVYVRMAEPRRPAPSTETAATPAAADAPTAPRARPAVIPAGKFQGVLIARMTAEELVVARREFARVDSATHGAIMGELSRRARVAQQKAYANRVRRHAHDRVRNPWMQYGVTELPQSA